MIGRLALRSLTAHPVRSAVLAAGFGFGVSVMAILLGVADIVLEQAQSPALVGGGDVRIRLSPSVPARLVLSGTLQSEALRPRVRAAAGSHTDELYLLHDGTVTPVRARGGIPSAERELGDPETATVDAWRDSRDDLAWTQASPDQLLRQIDRFHDVPDVPRWADSWAEWLYFNGRAGDTRFYLTFMAGPKADSGNRGAGVQLQLERSGQMDTFGGSADVTDADLANAPDVRIGSNSVRLEGMTYRIHLDLTDDSGRRVVGDLAIEASPGRFVPPIEIAGVRGWRTGYVVPVMSGDLSGALSVDGNSVPLDGGTGYHDHNWGFWEDVSWQWGQVQGDGLSLIYGRVFPPPEAADPEQFPGFVGALGPDGLLGYSTDVRITETNDAQGRPRAIDLRARGTALTLDLRFEVASIETTRMAQGPLGNGVNFLQMRGQYTVTGQVGTRDIQFAAPGSAETFRGQ